MVHLADWVKKVLSCTVGIRDRSSFWQKYKMAPPPKGSVGTSFSDGVVFALADFIVPIFIFLSRPCQGRC